MILEKVQVFKIRHMPETPLKVKLLTPCKIYWLNIKSIDFHLNKIHINIDQKYFLLQRSGLVCTLDPAWLEWSGQGCQGFFFPHFQKYILRNTF